jgi:hypothetical protein
MTKKWFMPERHIGYREDMSAEENVKLGKVRGESYLMIGRQLQALANVQENENPAASKKFREGAKLAFGLNKSKGFYDA